jgi:hypothetical protein
MDRRGGQSLARLALFSKWAGLKWNSWTYYFFEVSGQLLRVLRLEVSVWISWKRVLFTIRFSSCLLYCVHTEETIRSCVSLNLKGKIVEVILNSNVENSEDFCLDFVPEFGLCWVPMRRPLWFRNIWGLTAGRMRLTRGEPATAVLHLLLLLRKPQRRPRCVGRHTRENRLPFFYSAGTGFAVEVGTIQCPQKQLLFLFTNHSCAGVLEQSMGS